MDKFKVPGGLLLSFIVGVGCQLARIPVPSPPVLTGALLVFVMSLGYWLVDKYLAHQPAEQKKNCAGHDLTREARP
ncbi:hypothetical protein JCM19000A_03960 [Silvimonas sp. JCM 19000]